jgi:hypothetical protein
MTKLDDTMREHAPMPAVEITRVEIAKVSDPLLRGALDAIVDYVELVEKQAAPRAIAKAGPLATEGYFPADEPAAKKHK